MGITLKALKAKNLKLQKQIAKLEIENMALKNRIKALKGELLKKTKALAKEQSKGLPPQIEYIVPVRSRGELEIEVKDV